MHLLLEGDGAADASQVRHGAAVNERNGSIDYRSERLWPAPLPAVCSVNYTPDGPVSPAAVGTQEHFLAERYLLYTTDGSRLFRGQVNHTPYPLQTAAVHSLEENMVSAAGIDHGTEQPLAHYARSVHVDIFPLRPLATLDRRS